uniref:hypothetical protein n=1 Tax=Bacillus cereus group sp. BfR-BA-01517 TaxID=2920367 RepID=UPI001F57AA4E
KAPEGYKALEVTVEVNVVANEVVKQEVTNEKVTGQFEIVKVDAENEKILGSLQIIKMDDKDQTKRLAGAEFTLKDAKGNV